MRQTTIVSMLSGKQIHCVRHGCYNYVCGCTIPVHTGSLCVGEGVGEGLRRQMVRCVPVPMVCSVGRCKWCANRKERSLLVNCNAQEICVCKVQSVVAYHALLPVDNLVSFCSAGKQDPFFFITIGNSRYRSKVAKGREDCLRRCAQMS